MSGNNTSKPSLASLVHPTQDAERDRVEIEDRLTMLFESDVIIDYALMSMASDAESTTYSNLNHLKEFETALATNDVTVEEATLRDIRKYADSLAYKGARVRTIDGHLDAIKALYKHLEDELRLDVPRINLKGEDYAAQVPPETERKAISREKVRRLIEGGNTFRNTVIIGMFYYTGLRREELSNLDIDDVLSKRRIIRVRRGKGNKRRKVPYSQDLHHILTRWLDAKRPHFPKASNSSALFLRENGGQKAGRLGPEGSYRVLMKAAERTDIQEVIGKTSNGKNIYRVTPHVLRHSVATHMVEDGVPLRHIQRILGHSNIQTTLQYAKEAGNNVFNSYHDEFEGV